MALAEIPNAGKLKEVTNQNKSKVLGSISHSDYTNYEENAVFIGIVCIKDPVREEVKSAIADCHTAGIRVIMITGDSKQTAISVAKELNILEDYQNENKCCFTGTEFASMNNKER